MDHSAGAQELILVVDDDPLIRATLKQVLKRAGFSTEFAADGRQALEAVARRLPDLVLLDVRMPNLDGRATCEALVAGERTRAVPIIFLSAEKEAEDIVLGLELGAVDYVPKPFEGKVLLARIAGCLKRAREHQTQVVGLQQESKRLAVELEQTASRVRVYRLLAITFVLVAAAVAGMSLHYARMLRRLREAQQADRSPAELERRLAAQVEQGRALVEQGRPQEAIDQFNRVLQQQARFPGAIAGLARAHARLAELQARDGRLREARTSWRLAVELAGGDLRGGELARVEKLLEATGRISLVTRPAGAAVEIFPLDRRGGRTGPGRNLGRTPIDGATLGPGGYLLVLRLAGHLEARLPFELAARGQQALAVRLARADEASPGMVHIPAGPFWHNRTAAEPLRQRTLPDYLIDRTEVTQGEYARFIAATRHTPPPYWSKGRPDSRLDRHPVHMVSWHDAAAFARWAGKRLPTEAEWQKAARGADRRAYPWGDQFTPVRANVERQGGEFKLEPAGSRPQGASVYGVLQLGGNVQEWTADDGGPGKKLLRGGAWLYPAARARCDFLMAWPAGSRFGSVGFRCVKDLPDR